MVKKPVRCARLATARNLGCFSAAERAADAAIMDDNGLSAINNHNERFIIYNLSRSLSVSEAIKCTEYIRATDQE